MKKILNEPTAYVDEMLDGLVAAHPEIYHAHATRVIVRAGQKTPGKVGIVTGGGSGHLPVFAGYVGTGLLDGCAIGNVFASPSSEQMAETIRAVDAGAGVLCLYGNYGGDVMNFDMAAEMVDFEDSIRTVSHAVADDVASAPFDRALHAAEETVALFRERLNQAGRARIFGEKSAGLPDPGQLALVVMTEGLRPR